MIQDRLPVTIILVTLAFLFLILPAAAYPAAAIDSYNQGNTFIAEENYTAALAAYQHAVNVSPDYYEAWNGMATIFNHAGQYSEALTLSNITLQINSSYPAGWINRGQILYNLGNVYETQFHDPQTANALYTLQLQAFDKAIALDPNNAEAWFDKAFALGGLERYDEAIADFDKAEALDPNNTNIDHYRQMAIGLRDAAEPWYVRYAIPLGIGVVAVIGIIGWYVWKKRSG